VTPAFAMSGVVEGFYGAFYTPPERASLLRFLGAHGYNLYVYAPKSDRHHRARWREPYPEASMHDFADAVAVARESRVAFGYAIAPGLDIRYGDDADFDALAAKFEAFHQLGVRRFDVLLDDIASVFRHP
jgi:hyaluronoglucosaminidase